MAHLIGSYRLSAAGYDAANPRLLDESGLGNHLPLLAGTPDFTGSYSGKTCFKMHGGAYFGGPNILNPSRHTIIEVLHPKVLAGETLNTAWASARYYGADDHGHQAATLPFEDGTSSTNQLYAMRSRMGETSGRAGNDYHAVDAAGGLTIDAWNVVQSVWNGSTSQVRRRNNLGAWTSAPIGQHYQVLNYEEFRIGYRPIGLTVAANHLGALRTLVFAGDYPNEDPTEFAADVAAYIATPER